MQQHQSQSTVLLMRRLMREYVKPYVPRLVLAVIFMAMAAACTAGLAKLMEPVLDDIFVNRDQAQLIYIAGLIMGVFLIKGVATYGQAVLVSYVGQHIIADMQKQLFAHLMKADLDFFNKSSTGMLVSRFTNDVNLLRSAVSNVLTGVGKDTLTLAFLVALMFYQDWQMALTSFFAFPLAIYPIVKIGKKMRKISTHTQIELGAFTGHLDQAFQDMRHIKAYQMEENEAHNANRLIDELFRLIYRATKVKAVSKPIMETLGGVAIVTVIFYGGTQVIMGARTTGAFFSFITALLLAYEPMKKLANLNAYLQEGLSAAQRLFTMLDQAPQIANKKDAQPLVLKKGQVDFKNVSFSYGEGVALDAVSVKIPAGQTVALVGPSGAGKSTMLNLIPRFYDVNEGAVEIDGQDVRDITLESLRQNIALVAQEVGLFDQTVRENIIFGRAGATSAEVEAAAKAAAAHDFILELPNGYNTIVGEKGVNLSGGQRQRIAIARAILKNAPILLLDEATSALDSQSEQLVQATLKKLMKKRTTLVIAHRLSTIMEADLIYVIDNGKVVEKGSHADLLNHKGVYATLYEMQFSDQAA